MISNFTKTRGNLKIKLKKDPSKDLKRPLVESDEKIL